jgi:protein-tyrosine phosphatase
VDCHSHVVPSGDDGAESIDEGVELCREAARAGTRVLFATPHVWPHLTLTPEREAAVRAAFPAVRAQAGLELRLGFELTPTPALLREDPRRYILEGTDLVLMEVPFVGLADLLFALAERVEADGLRPVVAHPERTEAVLTEPGLADELIARGWLVQVNSTSLLGRHGEGPEELAWRLLERGTAVVVGSDGHRRTRPARLDDAYEVVRTRLGEDALRFFDGSPLGINAPRPTASRAASPVASATPARSDARARE